MIDNKTIIATRRKIIALFDRNALERLATLTRPGLADTTTLRENVMTGWPREKIADEVTQILYRAAPNH
jgi:hypothetical protein